MSTVFEQTFQKLNAAQKEAVEAIEGPVMLIAGPGTGKTHVLAARVAQILQKTDTPPYAILALTYTESGAVTMRNRLVKMIGKQGYYVQIMTFHAFCADVIRTHPEYFPIDRGSEALSDLEKYELFQQLIEKSELLALRPINAPLLYLRDIISAISHLKREGVTVEDFAEITREEFADLDGIKSKTEKKKLELQKAKNEELGLLYAAYQQAMRERKRYDFDDMIAFVVEAFSKHELLLREYQEQLHYFLVDEYQDTNTSQNTVINLLAAYWGDHANVFVVGDPNQSIFRFQGASTENTLGFIKDYPTAKVITLDQGYRGTQTIYNAASAVISENKLTQANEFAALQKAVSITLQSQSGAGSKIEVNVLPSQTLEHVFVAEEIKKLLSQGTLAENIGVLYRTNAEAVELQHVLEKWGIPYEIEGGENILEAEMIRQLVQVMLVVRDVRHGAEDEKLFEIMSYDWIGFSPALAMKIARTAGKTKITMVDLMQGGYENFLKSYGRTDVSEEDWAESERFLEKVTGWIIDDGKMVFTQWFEKFIKESGYLDFILGQENKAELIINLNTLFKEVKALVADQRGMKLDGFLNALVMMKEHRISLEAEDVNVEKGVVHLSTVHRAKGREWDYVFLTKCIDGVWGNTRSREMIKLPSGLLKNTHVDLKERNEDDRRLFYVAITRPRKKLYLSYPKTLINAHRSRAVTGSMFIEEIPELLKKYEEPEKISEFSHDHIVTLLQPEAKPMMRISDEAFFRDIVDNFVLSSTALNTYLRDTEEFVRNVLLKVPRAKQPHMSYGTAVHYALEKRNKALMTGETYSKEELLRDFEFSLKNELLSDEDFSARLKKGKEDLASYFDFYADNPGKPLFAERSFGKGFSKTVLGDIPLSGRIDRIDLLEDKKVRVIDYKTGKVKSVNDIEGKTAAEQLSERELVLPESIRGPYKRQLLFYKILTELDQTFPLTVEEGMFDFVQVNPTGKHIQRNFTLKKDDVEELKELIRVVMKEIRNLSFLTTDSNK